MPSRRSHIEKPRPEIATCYGHVSGVLAEQLCQWLLDRGWIEAERHNELTLNERITPAGLSGLAGWGVDVAKLSESMRKHVAICSDRYQSQRYEHVGGHLGTLLREWMERQGLIEPHLKGIRLTDHGRHGLIEAGVIVRSQLKGP